MADHVIHEETSGECRKLTPDEQREAYRHLMLGRDASVLPAPHVLLPRFGKPKPAPTGAMWPMWASVTAADIAAIHRQVLAERREPVVLAEDLAGEGEVR